MNIQQARDLHEEMAALIMIDDPNDAMTAIADALETYAQMIRKSEPYATVSIARYEAAARTVRDLQSAMANAEDDE